MKIEQAKDCLDMIKELLYDKQLDKYGRITFPHQLELAENVGKYILEAEENEKALEIIVNKRIDMFSFKISSWQFSIMKLLGELALLLKTILI